MKGILKAVGILVCIAVVICLGTVHPFLALVCAGLALMIALAGSARRQQPSTEQQRKPAAPTPPRPTQRRRAPRLAFWISCRRAEADRIQRDVITAAAADCLPDSQPGFSFA
jgi:hypothetical protein